MSEVQSIDLGKWAVGELDEVIRRAAVMEDASQRIAFLSEKFLGTPYLEDTLIGGKEKEEIFAVNLSGVDCFTMVDYVEAMRHSSSIDDFWVWLKRIRYREGVVSYRKRNHFLTDWIEYNKDLVTDATKGVGLTKTKTVNKSLNRKADGCLFVQGVDPVGREITFIPSHDVIGEVSARLRTGDYIGIYSDIEGLDVSHVGIFIRHEDASLLRHASSVRGVRKVVDQDFAGYVRNTPGIVVIRPI